MSNYKGHSTFNLLLLLPISLIFVFFVFHPSNKLLITFSTVFIYSTLYMSPDCDVADKISRKSLRGFLSLPFLLYSKVFRHRGISHIPVLGTTTRLFFLGGTIYVVLAVFHPGYLTLPGAIKLYSSHALQVHYGIAAVLIADLGHLFLDYAK